MTPRERGGNGGGGREGREGERKEEEEKMEKGKEDGMESEKERWSGGTDENARNGPATRATRGSV